MKVGLVVIHYPLIRYREEFISRVRRAGEVMRPTPGCLRRRRGDVFHCGGQDQKRGYQLL
jgi:hypothetical protein